MIAVQTAFNEDIDARKLPVGWTEPGYDDSEWETASLVDSPDWKLHAQETRMLTVYPGAPVQVVERRAGALLFRFRARSRRHAAGRFRRPGRRTG